ncbi:unnamed protein product [Macrosiphum euphorbiae]|uniref:Uncharacterized protein n=1 Tax=Macrosiphum euphorbiae TaxID=13131 RepID=A0AAV0WSG4_9HEMI|nr:unnamed protein product [Macrosiphum euphorbiae]
MKKIQATESGRGGCSPPITDGPTKTPIMSMKRPIILNKPAEGISHSVNVCSVHSCSLFMQDICEKAQDEWLLMKLTSDTKSSSAAKTIASAISSKLGDSVEKMFQLGMPRSS